MAVQRVAVATFSGVPRDLAGDQPLVEALAAAGVAASTVAWDDESADWTRFEAVLIRSTWNYTEHRDAFLRWVESLGARVHNAPAIVRWNSDKRYLADLAAAGLRVVPTVYVAPGDPLPTLLGDVVVKPTVSAGARNTGRFGEAAHDQARELIGALHAAGRTAMVQPYQAAVDVHGETAIVCFDGAPSHTLRKKPILRPDEVAPVRADGRGAAEAMYDPELMVTAIASDVELALARRVLDHVAERFGHVPLYGRVDMVPGPDGDPVLMELELIEPNCYLDRAPGAAERFAAAVVARLDGIEGSSTIR